MPIRFPGQKETEVIKFLIRKHWIAYVKLIVFAAVMIGIPLVIYLALIFNNGFEPNSKRIMTLIFLLYTNLMLLVTFVRWIEEDLDIIIVTNERIINIDQISFMHRTISETDLGRIQDVQHSSKGLLSHVFGFGSMEIQTAAEKITFCINEVPDPYNTARAIMDLRAKYLVEHGGMMSEN